MSARAFDAAGLKSSFHNWNLLWNLAGSRRVMAYLYAEKLPGLPRKRSQSISFRGRRVKLNLSFPLYPVTARAKISVYDLVDKMAQGR